MILKQHNFNYRFVMIFYMSIQTQKQYLKFPIPIGYQYIRTLGQGSFGVVYLIKNMKNDKLSCIKYLKNENQKDIQNFRKEIQAICKIQSENVCKYIASGIRRQFSYLQMEYIQGIDLQRLLDKNAVFTNLDLMDIMVQLSYTLYILHHKYHIIHRDIAPKNIIVVNKHICKLFNIQIDNNTISDNETKYKLIDFGLAKCMSSTQQINYTMAATPNYCAHEVVEGNGYTSKSDIYSLGCICYVLITGHAPIQFDHIKDIPNQQLQSQSVFNSIKYNDKYQQFPIQLRELIISMLNYDPLLRPTAIDCLRMLKDIAVDINYDKTIPDIYEQEMNIEKDTSE